LPQFFDNLGSLARPQGYSGDSIRQKFTEKERDNETGLDYFVARYYLSGQGRFTSPDPLSASAHPNIPQGWNRYSYVLNNPLKLVDPNDQDQNDAQVMASTSSQYQDITTGSNVRNIQTDVSKSEFIQNLADSGYKVTRSGNVTILDNGITRYAVYDVASSIKGITAGRSVGGVETLKIRLKP
jgi:RHS repeat-associated protein